LTCFIKNLISYNSHWHIFYYISYKTNKTSDKIQKTLGNVLEADVHTCLCYIQDIIHDHNLVPGFLS